jgi:hypothetical protein
MRAPNITRRCQLDAQRIDIAAVIQNLVVQMRSGRRTRRSDGADHLALTDPHTGAKSGRDFLQMQVAGRKTLGVGKPNLIAFRPPTMMPAKPGHRRRNHQRQRGQLRDGHYEPL